MILPRHVAIIMDGNGRWAKQRLLPRVAGHKAGIESVRRSIQYCLENKIEILTLFAFSSENWQRPEQEVSFLMNLFVAMLENEVKKLHEQNIQLRIIGDRTRFDHKLQKLMSSSEKLTEKNTGLKLVIAANYGGQWDICHAVQQLLAEIKETDLSAVKISPELLQSKLSLSDLPPPDLLIRTSGEQRISNFMLWQLAYAELYFTDVLWPDFSALEFEKAMVFFSSRERRFGCTSEQLAAPQ